VGAVDYFRARSRSLGVLAAGLCLGAPVAFAQDATWVGGNAGDTNEWVEPLNWTPQTVPTGTATFTDTGVTTVANDLGVVTIGAISFTGTPNAQAYTINVDNPFIVNGTGVTNDSTNTQTFNITSGNSLVFQNGSTANNGTGAVTYNNSFFIFFQNTSNAGNANTTFVNDEIIEFNDTSSAGSANFTNNIQIDFFDSTTAGNANITNNATGTITFNNTATAANATIGNSGALQFNNSATAGSAIITNNSGGTIDFNNSATAGTAQITNNSGGTVTFHDTSTAGTTATIGNDGTVNFNDNSSAGSAGITTTAAVSFNNSATAASSNIAVNIGGSLDFNNSSTAGSATITNNSGTVAFNNLSLGGTAQITNDATLQFNNVADAQSAAIVNNGTASFNNSATADTATITNNGTLTFNNSASAGSAGITTNTGGQVTFNDSGTGGTASFVFNGTGSMIVNSTAMTAGSIASASTGSSITLNNSLTVGGNNISTTFAGVITGGGGLDKVGTGTLTLSNGGNAYSGATTIDGGTLSLTGSIAGSSGVAIDSGGILDGTGAVSAISVNSGGTLMPGLPASVGTMQATSVTFASGASYLITINGTTNSKLAASGTATLDSGASVAVASGSKIVTGNKYTILTAAGGVTNTFNPIVDFGNFVGTLSYDPNDVFLTFQMESLQSLLPANAPRNVVNVANAIDGFTGGGGQLPAGFQGIFNLPPQQIVNALTQLSGEEATGAQLSGFQLLSEFMALLIDPLADGHGGLGGGPIGFAPGDRQTVYTPEVADAYAAVLKGRPAPAPAYGAWRAWGAAYGGSGSVNGDPSVTGSHDVTTRAAGFAAGLDYFASPDTRLGLALGGAGTRWDLADGLGGGHSDAFQAGLSGTQQLGPAYLSGALAFANFWTNTSRIVTVAGNDTLTASYDAQSLGGRVEGGYRLYPAPGIIVTPYAAFQAQRFRAPAYSEAAASGSPQFALSFNAQTSDAERAELGGWLADTFRLARGDTLTLFGRAAWAHDWFDNLALTPSFQSLPGASFVVDGAAPPADLALVSAGAAWQLRDHWAVTARFDGEFGDGAQSYAGSLRARYTW
jgi:uncharacterized protein with beta-barrel porin domain